MNGQNKEYNKAAASIVLSQFGWTQADFFSEFAQVFLRRLYFQIVLVVFLSC